MPTRDQEAYARARESIAHRAHRAQIDELFAGGQPLSETLQGAARLSMRR